MFYLWTVLGMAYWYGFCHSVELSYLCEVYWYNIVYMKTRGKVISVITLLLVLGVGAWFFFKFYFVFGEGVKAGELNYLTHKGYVFKTYEGRLIQSGYNSKNSTATIQSNEFRFSVENKQVADSLMRCTGKTVELHYKEYLGALPWRGVSEFVVDSIISVSAAPSPNMLW